MIGKKIKIFVFFAVFLLSGQVFGQEAKNKVKFYNFDDLLINGAYRKPQILYTDSREKAKFEKLLKLRKDFLKKLKSTEKDPSLR